MILAYPFVVVSVGVLTPEYRFLLSIRIHTEKHYDVCVIQESVATCPEQSSGLRKAVAMPVTSAHSSFSGAEGPESQGELPTS